MLSPKRASIDIFISPSDSPTGKAIRFRKRFAVESEAAAKALEAKIASSLYETGTWGGAAPALPPEGRPTGRTLQDALKLAWECPDEGWSRQRDGAKQHKLAKECLSVLGPYTPCAKIGRTDYTKLREAFEARGNSEATVTRKLQALYRVLYYAEREGWIRSRPRITRRKVSNARLFTFDKETEAKALAFWASTEVVPEMQDLFALAIEGGFRERELLTLEGKRVDLPAGLALIPDAFAKNGQFRQVVLTPRAVGILKRRIETHGKGLLFPGWKAKKVSDRMIAMRESLGIDNPECVFHATRHTAGSRMAAAGVPLADIMEQLGHKTPSMSLRYIHMTAEGRKRTILDRMAQR